MLINKVNWKIYHNNHPAKCNIESKKNTCLNGIQKNSIDLQSNYNIAFCSMPKVNIAVNSAEDYSKIDEITPLKFGVITKLPKNGYLSLYPNFIIDVTDKKIKDILDKKNEVLLGFGKNCDIILEKTKGVVSENILLKQKNDEIYAVNLSSKVPVKVIPQDKMKIFPDGVENIEVNRTLYGYNDIVSRIYALSQNPNTKDFVNNMVSLNEDRTYSVKFPNFDKIVINEKEIDELIKIDENRKHFIPANTSLRAIEKAYIKLFNSPNSKIKQSIEQVDQMEIIAGLKSNKYEVNDSKCDNLLGDLSKKCNDKYIMICTTPDRGNYGQYMDKEQVFPTNSSYIIKSINKNKKTIVIINSQNTKDVQQLQWKEFKDIFEKIFVTKVKNL